MKDLKSLGQRCSKKFQEKNTIIFLVCESPSSTRRGGSMTYQMSLKINIAFKSNKNYLYNLLIINKELY